MEPVCHLHSASEESLQPSGTTDARTGSSRFAQVTLPAIHWAAMHWHYSPTLVELRQWKLCTRERRPGQNQQRDRPTRKTANKHGNLWITELVLRNYNERHRIVSFACLVVSILWPGRFSTCTCHLASYLAGLTYLPSARLQNRFPWHAEQTGCWTYSLKILLRAHQFCMSLFMLMWILPQV